jgi:hypothetical protein
MVSKKSMRIARYAYNVDAYIAGSLYGHSCPPIIPPAHLFFFCREGVVEDKWVALQRLAIEFDKFDGPALGYWPVAGVGGAAKENKDARHSSNAVSAQNTCWLIQDGVSLSWGENHEGLYKNSIMPRPLSDQPVGSNVHTPHWKEPVIGRSIHTPIKGRPALTGPRDVLLSPLITGQNWSLRGVRPPHKKTFWPGAEGSV